MKNDPVIKEILLNAPVEKVWKAITDREEMKHWYFELSGFKPEVGFMFRFEGCKDDRVFVHLCRITEVIPLRKLSYSWQYEGLQGLTTVTFELFTEGNKTRLKLTHEGIENLASGGPDYDKSNFVEGWNHIIGTSLPKWVEGKR
jgi:uncharacterized protein YndB with AHSA1/START domain